MKNSNILYLFLLFVLINQSCREDIDIIEITPPNIPPIIKVISSIHGTVTDRDGNKVIGAFVSLEDETVETDQNGVFQFSNKAMNKNGSFVSVEKIGFFKGSRRLYPSVGNTNLVNIELIPLVFDNNFNSNFEASIVHEGIVLDFPKDAIVNQDGSVFNGKVNVAVAYLDPTDPTTLHQMPGDLTGISTIDGLVALKSLGMITVELEDDAGNELQVKDGNLVDVSIPIPNDLQVDAPASIPMWHFNEEIGIWVEEGSAELVGDHYETSLAHFSFWNCDIPNKFVFMKGSIQNRNMPLQGITVLILDSDSNTSGYGVTDENGMFCGYIPNNSELILIVYDQCGNVFYTTTFTTTDEDIFLDPITLNLMSDFAQITGTTSYCEDELSEHAYVYILSGLEGYTFPILDDGSFTGSIFYCNPGEEIKVTAFDPVNGLTSGEHIFMIDGDIEVGNIELCDTFVEHIIIDYPDYACNLLLDDDNLSNSLLYATDMITLGDEGFILNSSYEPDSGLKHIFKFRIPYEEGVPFQECRVEDINVANSYAAFAKGTCMSQLIMQDGVEYLFASGNLTADWPGFSDQPFYFEILVENIH